MTKYCWQDIECPRWMQMLTPPVFFYLGNRFLHHGVSSVLFETIGDYEFLVNALMASFVYAQHGVWFNLRNHEEGYHATADLRSGRFFRLSPTMVEATVEIGIGAIDQDTYVSVGVVDRRWSCRSSFSHGSCIPLEGGRKLGGFQVRHRDGVDPRQPGVVSPSQSEMSLSATDS